jgi:hypothetical protein
MSPPRDCLSSLMYLDVPFRRLNMYKGIDEEALDQLVELLLQVSWLNSPYIS